MRNSPVRIEPGLTLGLVLLDAGRPITERIQTRLSVLESAIEARARVLVDVASALPWFDSQ
jgi:hypothetical protein